MKYYICEEDNETLVVKKEISEEEFAHWKKCTEQLKYYSLAKSFRDIAIKNGMEIEGLLKHIRAVSEADEIKRINTTELGIEANRLMLNYLVSFRTYVDNIQAYSHHMKNGKTFERKIINWMYDNEEIYAFLSKLRNFATHFSMVFDSVTIDSDGIRLECSKEHLLEYKEWKQKNIDFINACQDEYLPILSYIEHNNILIMSIYIGFLSYFGDDLQEMHNDTIKLMTDYQIINPFFLECESESDLTGANLFSLGLDKLKQATDEFARLPNAKITYIGPEQIINKNDKS